MISVGNVEIDAVDDKELYILLGEIKRNQEIIFDKVEKMDEEGKRAREANFVKVDQMEKRMAVMESKINYAIGIVATIIFFFQAGWSYLTKMGKS
jgi:hypothetical protein